MVAGEKPGRQRDDKRIIAIDLGPALEDMAAALILYRRAVEKGRGTKLPL
jgi:ornithine cyclodeaminase